MKAPPRVRLTLTEAIDRAGPALYGTDWIGQCDAKEIRLLIKYGPKPYGQVQQSIGPCPNNFRTALDRAIGKDRRMLLQRTTVFDWIRAARVMVDAAHCNVDALEKKLQLAKRQKNPVGAPAVARERVMRQMRELLQSGAISAAELNGLKQETLESQFGASRKVCAAARKGVLSELSTKIN